MEREQEKERKSRVRPNVSSKEAHLCKVALRALVETNLECSAFAEQREDRTNPEKVVEEHTIEVAEQRRRQTTRSSESRTST